MSNSGLIVKCQLDRVLRETLKLKNGTLIRWNKGHQALQQARVRVRDREGLALLRLEGKDSETYK